MYGLTMNYIEYNVSVQVSVTAHEKLIFPAITVCNLSPVKKSAALSLLKNMSTKRKKRQSADVLTGGVLSGPGIY